jgi:hypothetical protein
MAGVGGIGDQLAKAREAHEKSKRDAAKITGGTGGGAGGGAGAGGMGIGGMGGGMGGIPISSIGNVNPFHEFMTQAEIAAGTWKGTLQYLRDKKAGMTSAEAAALYWGVPYTDPETGEIHEWMNVKDREEQKRAAGLLPPEGAIGASTTHHPDGTKTFKWVMEIDGNEVSKSLADEDDKLGGLAGG